MAVSAYRKASNHIRSITQHITNDITVNGVSYPVYYSWAHADPDNTMTPGTTPPAAFAVFEFPILMAGRQGSILCNTYSFSRIGNRGEANNDPLGYRAMEMDEVIEAIMRSHCFQVSDFVNPLSPVPLNHWLVMKGEGLEDPLERSLYPYRDTHNVVMTSYGLTLVSDMSKAGYHRDNR